MTNTLNCNFMRKVFLPALMIFLFLTKLSGQQNLVKGILPKVPSGFSVSVEYLNEFKEHCKTPIKYVIRKTGTAKENTIISWTFKYIPCGKTSQEKKTIEFRVPKGAANLVKEIAVHTVNMINPFDESSIRTEIIEAPEFEIGGPTSVMEGDDVTLQVYPKKPSSRTKWTWFRGNNKPNAVEGTSITKSLNSTTKFYVKAEVDGFSFGLKEHVVNVIKRPDPPSNFRINGPSEITDIQSAPLSIYTNSELEGVKWIWEGEGKKIGEGLNLSVSPSRTTSYQVHSEYYGKRSIVKSFQLNVRVLPEPPSDFSIVGPSTIYEGEKVWLKIKTASHNSSVQWVWSSSLNKGERVADSVLASLDESATYTVYAQLNGKKSGTETKAIKVIQKAVAPTIVGELKRCIGDTRTSNFSLKAGKLGTGSKKWNWYEGECGSGRMIHSGNEISLSPSQTTAYYVQPDNNPQVCKAFMIEVGNAPVLPEKIIANAIACANEIISLEAVGKNEETTKWMWFAKGLNGGAPLYKGEGRMLRDTVKEATVYLLRSGNQYCELKEEKTHIIEVKEQSSAPENVFAVPVKGKQYLLKVSGVHLAEGSQWVWYKGSCSGSLIGYGEQVQYKAGKKNNLFVRAEGRCDTTTCEALYFEHASIKSRFFFVNFGLSSNQFYQDIGDYNAQVTLGSNKVYLRAKFPISVFEPDSKGSMPGFGGELENDDTKITNYPANSNSYYVFDGNTYNKTYSLSGGLLFGSSVIKCFAGGGYGKRELYWGAELRQYGSDTFITTLRSRNTAQSFFGPVVEAGLFLKLGSVNMMGGMSMMLGPNSNQYRDAHVGIGINFNKKAK